MRHRRCRAVGVLDRGEASVLTSPRFVNSFQNTIRSPRPSASTRSSWRGACTPAGRAQLRESIVDGELPRGRRSSRRSSPPSSRSAAGPCAARSRCSRARGSSRRGRTGAWSPFASAPRTCTTCSRVRLELESSAVRRGPAIRGDVEPVRAALRGVPAGGRVDRAARRARHRLPPRARRVRRRAASCSAPGSRWRRCSRP